MKRTFNYTGRRSIPKRCVSIRLRPPSDGRRDPSFSASFEDLTALGLPPEATIYVEPYVSGGAAMRFAFGTVGAPVAPANTVLDELDAGGRILFRVKVVDERTAVGRILASVSEVTARDETEDDGRKPILPLRHTDLGENLWDLNIVESSGPELLVSNRVPELADRIKSDPLMQGMVLPHALRTIVRHLLSDDDESEWRVDWRILAERVNGEPIDWELDPEDEGDEVDRLIERIVRKFVEWQRYASRADATGARDG